MIKLRKLLLFLIMFSFSFLVIGFNMTVKATSKTIIAAATTKSAATLSGDCEGISVTYAQTAATLYQITASNSMTYTFSGTGLEGKSITKIVLNMKSNSSKGKGSLSVKAGTTEIASIADNTFSNKVWNGAWSTSYVDITPTLTNSEYKIQSGESVVITIAATANSLYCQSVTLTLEDGTTEPSVYVNEPTSSDMMIGTNLTLTSATQNISEVTTDVWASSNEEVATVKDGVVTPLKMGSTTISRTVNGTKSNNVELKVWPNNTDAITIAQALEIVEFASGNTSAYSYKTSGTVEAVVDTSNFTLTDETGSINVYAKNHGLPVGKTVEVNGYLNVYSDSKQFNKPTLTYTWTVTFDSNGGNRTPEVQNVSPNGVATKPVIDIEKDGYELSGWYLNDTEYNFSTPVTSDITLTAKWIKSASVVAKDNLDKVNQYVSLGYKYNANVTEGSGNYVKLTSIYNVNAGDEIIIVSKYNDKYYALINDFDTKYGKYLDITDLINNGTLNTISSTAVWTLGGSASAYTLQNGENYINGESDDTPISLSTTPCASFNLVATDAKSYIGVGDRALIINSSLQFKNFGANNVGKSGYASETFIYVKEKTATTYTDVDFRIRVGIDSTIDTYENGYASEYGIEVKTADKTVKYAYTNTLIQKDDSISYVIIDLGDLIANPSRFDTKFTICAFATIDGTTYYSQCVRVFSVKDLVKEYSNQETTKAQVEGLKTLLQKLGYTFE